MIGGVASVVGLIVGFILGGIVVAHSYGEPLLFGQGVALTLLTIIWLAFTVWAVLVEGSESS